MTRIRIRSRRWARGRSCGRQRSTAAGCRSHEEAATAQPVLLRQDAAATRRPQPLNQFYCGRMPQPRGGRNRSTSSTAAGCRSHEEAATAQPVLLRQDAAATRRPQPLNQFYCGRMPQPRGGRNRSTSSTAAGCRSHEEAATAQPVLLRQDAAATKWRISGSAFRGTKKNCNGFIKGL